MELKKLKISEVIRYGFSGLNAILIIVFMPFIVLFPAETFAIIKIDVILLFLILCFAIGYLIDSMKLYQLKWHYKKNKTVFLKKFSEILGIREDLATVYYSITLHFLDSKDYSLERKHAEWVLSGNNSTFFLVSTIVWFIISIIKILNQSEFNTIIISIVILVVSSLFGLRFSIVTHQERIKLDNLFYEFTEQNKSLILTSIKVK